jgi:zinc D-Ala-D-Ala carboxypeptidase
MTTEGHPRFLCYNACHMKIAYQRILVFFLIVMSIATASLTYILISKQHLFSNTEETLKTRITEITKSNEEKNAHIAELESKLRDTEQILASTTNAKDLLSKDLDDEKNRNDAFEAQISEIGSTINDLDKLAKTDPELLMKYSKVYFLNEHYTPSKLTQIDNKYLYDESIPKFIHAQVNPFLEDMIREASDDNIKLWVRSAYRSFDEQEDLKGAYTVAYGSGANTFSADQGYSEHQLGTTIDLTTTGINGGLTGFETTLAYTWLKEHAHEYGFVLSYPHNNTYYIFEPWHWRFVGIDLATDLHADEKNFYDLDQREIDSYLISIFD